MTNVKKLPSGAYEVSDFVRSMPHLVFRVRQLGDHFEVVDREGTTERVWDQHAVDAVTNHVEQALCS